LSREATHLKPDKRDGLIIRWVASLDSLIRWVASLDNFDKRDGLIIR
jgi:hypothetical protein